MANSKDLFSVCLLSIFVLTTTGGPILTDVCETMLCYIGSKCDVQFCLENSQCKLCGRCIPETQEYTVFNHPCYYTKCSRGLYCAESICNGTVETASECSFCYRCAPFPDLAEI